MTFEKKLIEQLKKIIRQAEMDMDITGNAYWKFTDRKIELVNPKEIKIEDNFIQTIKTNDKLYGKSILE